MLSTLRKINTLLWLTESVQGYNEDDYTSVNLVIMLISPHLENDLAEVHPQSLFPNLIPWLFLHIFASEEFSSLNIQTCLHGWAAITAVCHISQCTHVWVMYMLFWWWVWILFPCICVSSGHSTSEKGKHLLRTSCQATRALPGKN